MSNAKRLAKRWAREHSAARKKLKQDTWRCRCGERHPMNERCPYYRGDPPPLMDMALLGMLGGNR